jgi:anaphase-promoting complex subunit 8
MEKSLVQNNFVILNKTNANEIVKELTSCVLTYDYLCLSRTQKWCSEMLYAIDEATPINEYESFRNEYFNLIDPKEFRRFQLARSCFNSKEFLRASFYLKDCESPAGYFLNVYSKYMAIMKKCADNKSDLFNNMDSSNFDSLQSLRNELSTKCFKNQLDAFSLYV